MKFQTIIFSLIGLLMTQSAFAQMDSCRESCYQDECCAPQNECECCCTKNHGFYVGGLVGPNWLKPTDHLLKKYGRFKTGYALAGSIGYKFTSLRVEGEYNFHRNAVKFSDGYEEVGGHITTSLLMVNVINDFFTLTDYFKIYGGIGFGYCNTKLNLNHKEYDFHLKSKQNCTALQYILGVNTLVTHNIEAGIEYRYLALRKHIGEHTVGLSIRRFF